MGVLNLTPDSFSDGGRHLDPGEALEHAERLVDEGADLLDVGAESTRPGAEIVSLAEEEKRLLPVLGRLRRRVSIPISVDTRRAAVARRALDEGADLINDVSALADPHMPGVVSQAGAGVVLMHMRGTPRTMQDDPRYTDVVREVRDELRARLELATSEGIAEESVALDPGIGFAKTGEHNLQLIAGLPSLAALGRPLVLGVSRKRFLGELLGGAPPEARLHATVGACVAGLLRGARIFRVHDVRPVREALLAAHAVLGAART
jgi:dihydropteroate synthase